MDSAPPRSAPAPANCDAPGAAPTRRIGKSSDPDHPFHPCDDIDSDDAAIEALLDSSSGDTQESELDYDPDDPYRDPFARYVPPATSSVTPANAQPETVKATGPRSIQITLSKESFDALLLARDQSVAAHHATATPPRPARVPAQATTGHSPGASPQPTFGHPAALNPSANARDDGSRCDLHTPEKHVQSPSDLDPIRDQLDSLLSPDARSSEPALKPVQIDGCTAASAPQPVRLLTCTVLSMLLNVVAFCAAIVFGAHQFWGSGTQGHATSPSAVALAAVSSLSFVIALLRTGAD
eukprot:5227375-Pleurochrysis_carterae.AAC.1